MAKAFEIGTRREGSTLVLKLAGDLDGSSACEIAVFLEQATGHHERFIIDGTGLGSVHPFGRAVLEKALKRLRLIGSELMIREKPATR